MATSTAAAAMFGPNIFFAKPADYLKMTQKVSIAGPDASYLSLPLVK